MKDSEKKIADFSRFSFKKYEKFSRVQQDFKNEDPCLQENVNFKINYYSG